MKNYFVFFSGYAHRDVKVIQCKKDFELKIITLTCTNHGKHTLSMRNYIQIEGVLFEVTETNGFQFKACSTLEMIKNTSLEKVSSGKILTLGVEADKDLSHEHLWMLQPSSIGQVTYKNHSDLEGHNHTLKLDFEAPREFSTVIQSDLHLGLAGSSLTVKEISHERNLIKFSIYCGKETRENTQFNQDLESGTLINITEAAAIVDRTHKP